MRTQRQGCWQGEDVSEFRAWVGMERCAWVKGLGRDNVAKKIRRTTSDRNNMLGREDLIG